MVQPLADESLSSAVLQSAAALGEWQLQSALMTGRRQSYLEHWAPLHGMTVSEGVAEFPKQAAIARYGMPQEIAELMAFLVSASWLPGSAVRMNGGKVKSV